MADRPTFVLVHGAWHGAWCWDEVAARLRADGAPVVAVDLPSVTGGGDMYDDARFVRDAIAQAAARRSSSGTPTAASSSPRRRPAQRACATWST